MNIYHVWARIYTGSEEDRADEHLWLGWRKAERVALKAVEVVKSRGGAVKAGHENLLANYEITLGRIFCHQSKYIDAARVLGDAFARLKNNRD